MLGFLTWTARVAAALGVVGLALWLFGPYERFDTKAQFDPNSLPEDLDAYLAQTEALVPGVTPGAEKRILWHGAPGAQTDLAVIYIHGFSATSEEIRPVPERVADALKANLYVTRLRGHGRDGAAMAAATATEWLEDVAEAYAIGRRIGKEVIVISASTGGTLAAITAVDPSLSLGIKGHAFVSPNFGLAHPAGALLSWPAARYWVPLLVGSERSFPIRNAAHGTFWTTTYPTVATLPMAAVVKEAARTDLGAATVGALFLFSDNDQVVSGQAIRAAALKWGGPVTLEAVTVGAHDDPYSHIIAGDVMSPGMTDRAVEVIVEWVFGLNSAPQ